MIAEDINSDNTLRCVVTFDHIAALTVVSKTRELYLTEAPEVFEIRAVDSQGNKIINCNKPFHEAILFHIFL